MPLTLTWACCWTIIKKGDGDDNQIKRELKNAIEKIRKILKNMEDEIDSTNKDDIRDKIGDSTYDLY